MKQAQFLQSQSPKPISKKENKNNNKSYGLELDDLYGKEISWSDHYELDDLRTRGNGNAMPFQQAKNNLVVTNW